MDKMSAVKEGEQVMALFVALLLEIVEFLRGCFWPRLF